MRGYLVWLSEKVWNTVVFFLSFMIASFSVGRVIASNMHMLFALNFIKCKMHIRLKDIILLLQSP